MYTVPQMCRFHAGFGKSDLTRVFWESRAAQATAQFRATAADTSRRKTVFQPPKARVRARYWEYLPRFLSVRAVVCRGCVPQSRRVKYKSQRYVHPPCIVFENKYGECCNFHRSSSHVLPREFIYIWDFRY